MTKGQKQTGSSSKGLIKYSSKGVLIILDVVLKATYVFCDISRLTFLYKY